MTSHAPFGRRTSVDVARHIEQLIASGQLTEGDRLPPERELAERFAISRTSVREAMYELSLKGLLERRPGRGTIVTATNRSLPLLADVPLDRRMMFEVADLREVLEPAIAARAAARATSSDLIQLDDILKRTDIRSSAKRSVECDEAFHLQLARCTHNTLLFQLAEITTAKVRVARARSHRTVAGRTESLRGHELIYDAVRRNDSEAAEKAMVSHIQDVGRLIADGEHSTDE